MPVAELKKRSVLAMVLLTIVTFGFYCPVWFLRRRPGLNALDSPRKVPAWPFLLLLALMAVQVLVGFAAAGRLPEQVIGAGPALTLRLARLAIGILVLIQCFRIKDILEDHLAGPEGSQPAMLMATRVQLSGLMTFLFTIFYLQYVINRDLLAAGLHESPATG